MGEVVRFYAVTSIGILINVESMNVLVSMGMYDLLALVLTTGFTFVFNFMLSKFWIFRSAEVEPELASQS
jgi:putative flippase GtrA